MAKYTYLPTYTDIVKITQFNSIYTRNKLPKTKDGAYGINLGEYKSIGSHWIALFVYVNGDNVTYIDSYGVESILNKMKKIIRTKIL